MSRIYIFVLPLFILLLSSCNANPEMELVWSEEFDYEGAPSEEFWVYEEGYIRNKELQYYSKAPENIRVKDGVCTITARLENTDSITSASITTEGKIDFLYGRMELRAQIPSSLGSWPAIWMLGTNIREIGWPSCGEIDIMEHVGYNPDLVHATVHTKAYNHRLGTGKGSVIKVSDPWSDFHVYAVEWYEDHMDFFFDDSLYHSYENDLQGNSDTWPFDKTHYLLVNLAFGGGWGGQEGVDSSSLPLEFKIDYIRYYKLN